MISKELKRALWPSYVRTVPELIWAWLFGEP